MSVAAAVAASTTTTTTRRRHSRRRFACGRHLAELCACPASEYTCYRRKDAAQLRSAAKALTSVEEHLEVWHEEARSALAAAGGSLATSLRYASVGKGGGSGGGNSGSGGGGGDAVAVAAAAAAAAAGGAAETAAVKVEVPPSSSDASTTPLSSPDSSSCCSSSRDGSSSSGGAAAAVAKAEEGGGGGGDHPAAGGKLDATASVAATETELLPPSEKQLGEVALKRNSGDGDGEFKTTSSLIPAGWHDRPSLRYVSELIRVGEELGAPEPVLTALREIVDACAGWVKTVEMILGASDSDSSAAAAISFGTTKRAASLSAAAAGGGASGAGGDGGGGKGRAAAGGRSHRGASSAAGGSGGGGGRSSRSTEGSKRREQVPFYKAMRMLVDEGKLPARPVETTEKFCVAVIAACRLRVQARTLLGLEEDEVRACALAWLFVVVFVVAGVVVCLCSLERITCPECVFFVALCWLVSSR